MRGKNRGLVMYVGMMDLTGASKEQCENQKLRIQKSVKTMIGSSTILLLLQ